MKCRLTLLAWRSFDKLMAARTLVVTILALKVIRVCIVNFVLILVEDLELDEVNTLLDEVDISEVLQMEDKFDDCS